MIISIQLIGASEYQTREATTMWNGELLIHEHEFRVFPNEINMIRFIFKHTSQSKRLISPNIYMTQDLVNMKTKLSNHSKMKTFFRQF